ncbi:MAG: S8 family serine peptidase, partial [Candidatus Eiseniibacteriota bacterium]
GYINILNGSGPTPNGDNELYIEIFDAATTRRPRVGTWTFTFTPTSITSTGRMDMWLFGNGLGDGLSLVPFVQGLATGGVIGSPASADSAICVGAHTTKACWTSIDGSGYCWNPAPNLNEIASFSSNGPLRDGRIKPDITAPGFGVATTKSANITPAPGSALIVNDGAHWMGPGTSFSAPHVTGAVALLLTLPQYATAGPAAMRARLQETARADAFTGAVPNNAFGYGKLNIGAAVGSPMQLAISHPSKGQYIPPGKQDSVQVTLTGPTMADSVALDLSTNGGGSYGIHLGTLTSVVTGTPRSLTFFPDLTMVTMQGKVRATTYRPGFTTATAFSDSLFLIQTPTAVELVSSAPAQRFELGANSPNPFNPMTSIAFGVATPGQVTLRIFNAGGQLVRTLVDKSMPAGTYRARWDGKNQTGKAVASGVYLYELSSDGQQLTRKMSLLK